MNILTTDHQDTPVVATKGEALGKIGVFIVVGIVGLVFATTFVAVQATINNQSIKITQVDNILTAQINDDDLASGDVSWSWFPVDASYSSRDNNSTALADKCQEINQKHQLAGETASTDTSFDLHLSQDNVSNLYCFRIAFEADGELQVNYGGYVPNK